MHRERKRTIRNRVARLALISLSVLVALSAVAVLADEPPFVATNAVVIDADTGHVLYARNIHQPVPPGDLSQIITAIVALESAAIDTRMTIAGSDLSGDSDIGWQAGADVSLVTLLYGMLLRGDNDAAVTIARSLGELPGDDANQSIERFMERVNTTVGRLGLENTALVNPHGAEHGEDVSSAADIAAITMVALNNPFFRGIVAAPYAYREGFEFYNRNPMQHRYSGLVGGVVGDSDVHGFASVQIAERNQRTIIAVLMGSSEDRWMSDAAYLLDVGFAELERAPNDAGRPVVGLISPEIEVPDLTMSETPEADAEVQDSVGGHAQPPEATEAEPEEPASSPSGGLDPLSWEWPVFLTAAILAAVAIALGLTRLLGTRGLALEHRTADRSQEPAFPIQEQRLRPLRTAIRPRVAASTPPVPRIETTQAVQVQDPPVTEPSPPSVISAPEYGVRDVTRPTGPPRSATIEAPVTGESPARALACRAIRLATQSQYQNAAQSFKQAFELDPEVDLTTCPGFQRLQPMGYIAIAKGYVLNGQSEAARNLLSKTRENFGANPDLRALFGQAIRALDESPPVDTGESNTC